MILSIWIMKRKIKIGLKTMNFIFDCDLKAQSAISDMNKVTQA